MDALSPSRLNQEKKKQKNNPIDKLTAAFDFDGFYWVFFQMGFTELWSS